MKNYRRTTSCWLTSQALCFCLLLQGSGIAEALPLPERQEFISQAELEDALAGTQTYGPSTEPGSESNGWLSSFWNAAAETGDTLETWIRSSWRAQKQYPVASRSGSVQLASAGSVLPLPARLMSAIMAPTGRGKNGPPSPPSMAKSAGLKPPANIAGLIHKNATEEIQLLAGYNLISIPEEPLDTAPSAVFAGIAGQLERAEAYDACDLTDPWKLYDPADPGASDLTIVDHKVGMWVRTNAPALLPSDGTLPATTTLQLCEGWNLIGFPAGQPRHPLAVLAPIAGKWQRLFAYDVFDAEDPWEVYDPAVPDWANDLQLMYPGRGYWLLASEATTLEIRNQGPAPTIAITSPADLAVITEPTEITGTVESDRLESWTLTYRAIDDGAPVILTSSTAPISGGTLATFDPTLLLNGLYELELTATDVEGQQVAESIAVSVEGQMKIGHFTLSFVDLTVPVAGLDIEIVRTYDSRDKQRRDFGVGWTMDILQGSYVNNRTPGDGWQFQTGFLPCDTILESKSHLTVVRLSEREVYRFALRLENGVPSTGGGCFGNARFDFVDGSLPGSTLEILGQTQVFYENGYDQVIDVDTLEVFEPDDVRLVTRDGRTFDFDLQDGVTQIEDLSGNQLSITPSGIVHSSGRGIAFDRDAQGRITGITDPLERSMVYVYDAAGDLVRFADRTDNTTRFTYDDNHRLLDIEDPRGVTPVRNEYDSDGRLVRHIDAFGKAIELGHDLENRREVVTNRLGHTRVVEYDARGNVVRETDELGNITTRTFDSRDNLLSETDPLGHTSVYTYSGDDLESFTDPLGHETRYTYDTHGRLLTMTDPRGGVTTNVYHPNGGFDEVTDALGATTHFTYDAAGNLLTTTDALGQVTTFEYDAFGNETRQTDALGNVSESTYDSRGNRLTETRTRTLADGSTETQVKTLIFNDLDRATSVDTNGSTIRVSYDLLGNILQRTDPLGRTMRMTYDPMGQLTSTTFPDSTVESRTYDAAGQLTTWTDRAGRTTSYTYDAAGRQLSVTYPDGAVSSNTYDAAGQLIATTDARGNTTTFVFDAAGRGTSMIDPLGNGPTFTYDGSGNQTALTDAKGQTTTFTYDAAGRLITTTYPDGTESKISYDSLGRRIAETDQAGTTTDFTYDALDRLSSVKDALEQVTSYTYDEVGNRITQTDPNGRVTRFEYDSLGRQTARILPDGARESRVFNLDSTLASHTDFNGDTRIFEYDAERRLTRRAYPDGHDVTFTYTATGQRATVIDSRGTTSYAYDARDRLLEKTEPTGHRLSYTYDLEGNRTGMTATVGAATFDFSYAYDALDRLVSVTDSQNGVTALSYDLNGNRQSLGFPNGATTGYSYDTLNRLTGLSTASDSGNVLQSYAYALDASGNRTRIDEHDGTSRHYVYDSLYRLTQDRVTDASTAEIYRRDFNYDPAGNRLAQTVDEGSGPVVTNSTYDTRDRLTTAASATYGWDANGNLTSRSDLGVTSYGWDSENRLTSVTLDDGKVVETLYDADGNRVRTVVTPPDGPSTSVDYLVDTVGFLSHVVVEIADSTAQTIYTRADGQLVGLYRPSLGASKYYHADGLGSVRVLSDGAGAVTDRYTYSAFGELLEHSGSDLNPYRFAGEPYDSNSGFYFNRARWLDVQSGRFIASDPFPGLARQPLSLHKYLYAHANPVNLVDPTGLFSGGLGEVNIVTVVQVSLAAINAFSLIQNINQSIAYAAKTQQAIYEGRHWAAVAYASIAFLHAVLAAFNLVALTVGIKGPPAGFAVATAIGRVSGPEQLRLFWQIVLANPKLRQWVLAQVTPAVMSLSVMFSQSAQGNNSGSSVSDDGFDRGDARIEDGNANQGWQHIEARHITGTDPGHGPTDLFPPGTTRPQLQNLASWLVRKGTRTSNPADRIQVFKRRTTFNGQRATFRVVVDSQDRNRVITIFPAIQAP